MITKSPSKQKEVLEKHIATAEEEILNSDTLEEDEFTESKMENDRKRLSEVKCKIQNGEKSLGVTGRKAVKIRVRHKLCQRKFEFDRFERVAQ